MRQKILKWVTALSGCLVIFWLYGVNVQAAEYSISANDSWTEGSTENTEKRDVNYYTFTIPSSGRVTVTHQSYKSEGRCRLLDKDLTKEYREFDASGSDTSPGTSIGSIDLEAGTYSLKLWCAKWNDYNAKYRVKVSFVPAHNNETEPNNNFETAMPLSNGTLIKGFLSEDDGIDFYKFSIGEGANIRTTVSRGTIGHYEFSVWNSDLIEVDSYDTGEQTKVWEKYLAPGTYYIKINRENYGDRTGTYTLKWEGFTYVKSIQLKKSVLTLEKGKSYNLFQSISPASANNKNIQWTSDNTSVAKVDPHGKVTAKGIGAATIKAAAMDGSNVEATCQIVVKPTKTQITKCKKSKDRNVTVKVKAQKNVSGIQYQLSRKKNFKGKTSSYYAGATETKATTATLKKNKTYYFRARMYIDYGGKRYYGAWSQVKKVKTGKKTILTGYYSWKGV